MKKCSNLYVHGPFEQTYTNDQLSYAQGTIVETDEDKLQYTVEVRMPSITSPRLFQACVNLGGV